MTKEKLALAKRYSLQNSEPGSPDAAHPQRVLHLALNLANSQPQANLEVLILACLLHDVGRAKPQTGKSHAALGAAMAYAFLIENGWDEKTAKNVKSCIKTHSRGRKQKPKSIEAKILYDADKLDYSGATGCVRMAAMAGMRGDPFYTPDKTGVPLRGENEERASLLKELHKRQKERGDYYTKAGKKLGKKRDRYLRKFFARLQKEIILPAQTAADLLTEKHLKNSE